MNVDDPVDPEKLRKLARSLSLSFPILLGSEDMASIYNILYRYLFDRHRDMRLPTSFLIDAKGEIVKVYQGPVHPEHVEADHRSIPQTDIQRLALALPFSGLSNGLEFRRNYYGYGSIYFQHGYYDQAEASFRLALNDDPSNAEALYGLGSVYLKKEKNTEARESFERTVKLKTNYPKYSDQCLEQPGDSDRTRGKDAGGDIVFSGSPAAGSRPPGCSRQSGSCVPAAAKLG